MLDLIHILLLLGACFACFVAGQINGATGLVKLLIEHDILTKEDFDKFQIKLEKDDK